jgi:SPOR domain
MAESDHDADDPLANLAQLIGRSVSMNRSAQDRRSSIGERYAAPNEVEPSGKYWAGNENHRDPEFGHPYDIGNEELYDSSARANPSLPFRASDLDREQDFDSATASQMAHELNDFGGGHSDKAASRDAAEESSAVHDSHYDEYDRETRDYSDDNAYGENGENSGNFDALRRSRWIFVTAIFGLMVLGTAGAFAYRAVLGGPILPTLPPITKKGDPNKIILSDAYSQPGPARQTDANNAGSGEKLVSAGQRPVEMPLTASTAPRPATVFADPPAAGGPDAVVGSPNAAAPSSNLGSTQLSDVARGDIPQAASGKPVMTLPANSAANVPAASGAAPSVVAPVVPAVPGPKKIRTVTIHSDHPNAPDSDAGSRAPSSQREANKPLSIVPSDDGSAPAARPRTAPPQPIALNKPPANENASTTRVAPTVGYAVQVSSHQSEEEAQSSFRDLQTKYPKLLGGYAPIIRRADLGAKGIYYRAMVGPFASADQARELCSNLKATGVRCLVQKN